MPIEVILLIVFVVAMLAYFIFRYFKYGSLRGAVYRSPVLKDVGEVELKSFGGVSTTLRVYVLEDRRIVLEKASRALQSYTLEGFPMSAHDADQLIHLLQQAKV